MRRAFRKDVSEEMAISVPVKSLFRPGALGRDTFGVLADRMAFSFV